VRIGLFVPTLKRDYDRVQSAIWIRALQMQEPLRALGHDVSINNPFRRYDVAIYHRGMRRKSVSVMRLLRTIARRVYWDTCVDYFEPHEAADAEQVESARAIAKIADGICVPAAGIQASAQRFSRNVFVMPDPINLQHFAQPKTGIDWTNAVFGWSGVAVKAWVLEQYKDFLDGRTRIISETQPSLAFDYQFEKWAHADFPAALRRCDIGFLPRGLNSPYEVNNSSFKALVFAALGLPIIANRLPSYQVMAEHYDGIVFLEDFGGNADAALSVLRERNLDPSRVRQAYDRFFWAGRLADWFHD
jgi:hypothetical protein